MFLGTKPGDMILLHNGNYSTHVNIKTHLREVEAAYLLPTSAAVTAAKPKTPNPKS